MAIKKSLLIGAAVLCGSAAAAHYGADYLNGLFGLQGRIFSGGNAVQGNQSTTPPNANSSGVTVASQPLVNGNAGVLNQAPPSIGGAVSASAANPAPSSAAPAPTAGTASPGPASLKPGLRAEYFNLPAQGWNGVLPSDEATLERIESGLFFQWGRGSPSPRIQPTMFAARWTGFLLIEDIGKYTFNVTARHGVRITINNQLVVDQWPKIRRSLTFDLQMPTSGWVPIHIDYWGGRIDSQFKLEWAIPNASNLTLIPAGFLGH